MRLTRRLALLAAASATLLTACGAANSSAGGGKAQDMALGAENAPVTIIEYASFSCPACAQFHETVLPELKKNYIDTGKVRFIFREFPAGNAEIGAIGALVARCVADSPAKYFKTADALFDQQMAIFQAAQQNQHRQKFLDIARASGVSEEEYSKCVSDPDQIAKLNAQAEEAHKKYGITSTPTLVLDGKVLPNTESNPYTYESLAAQIDAKLAK
jgi:protein-disulfide isomerase